MRCVGCFLLPLVAISAPGAQKPWVENQAQYEEWLQTAEILEVVDVGHGVTNPKKVTLKQGDVAFHGAYKPIKRGRQGGFWESYQAELAAYRLDKLLELDMVPPTVVRNVDKGQGSLQFWVPDCALYKEVEGTFQMTPDFSQQVSRMKMFDNLIFNGDRNAGNFLIDAAHNVILIDHSRAFIDRKDLLKNWLPNQFDRRLVERMKTLTKEQLKSHFDDLLMGGQIDSILVRRDKLLEHLEKLIAKNGERAVLFD